MLLPRDIYLELYCDLWHAFLIHNVALSKAVSDFVSQPQPVLCQASWYLTPRWERRAAEEKGWSITLRSPLDPQACLGEYMSPPGGSLWEIAPLPCFPPLSWLGNIPPVKDIIPPLWRRHEMQYNYKARDATLSWVLNRCKTMVGCF